MKYANAISPERMNATGRVNRPRRMSVPPTTSMTPANHGSDPTGAVPPPGMIAAGKANHFAEPTWKYRKATTILRTLSSCGAHSFFTEPPVFFEVTHAHGSFASVQPRARAQRALRRSDRVWRADPRAHSATDDNPPTPDRLSANRRPRGRQRDRRPYPAPPPGSTG